MSKDIREMIDKVKNFNQFVNENYKTDLTPDLYNLIRSEEFKKWFGDWENDKENSSKVVDENGVPLLVYHGSKDSNIQQFKTGENYTSGGGIFFTNSLTGAKSYSRNPTVYKAFLNIRNPEIKNANGRKWDEVEIDVTIWDVVKKAKNSGYDGVIVKNVIDLGGYTQFLDLTQDDYVVFNNDQIKMV